MDLVDLRLVACVAEAGSITHGAARAHLSLPSASARIRALEHTVGAALFDRDRRGVTPTPAGTLLLRHAREICQAVDQMNGELADHAEGHGATVRVLANTASTASLLPAALTTFLAAHPRTRVDLEERPSHQIVAAVAEHRADLGIVADTVDLGRLRTHTLRPDPLVVLAAHGDPLTGRESVEYAEILDRAFVGLSRGSALYEHLEGHAAPLGSRPTYRVRLPSPEAVCAAVAAGVGITVLPRHIAEPWITPGPLRPIDLTDPWASTRHLKLCHPPDQALTTPARALHNHLTKAATTDENSGCQRQPSP